MPPLRRVTVANLSPIGSAADALGSWHAAGRPSTDRRFRRGGSGGRRPEAIGGVGVAKGMEETAMSLNEELKALRERLEARRPPEVVATMHRAVDELRASGAAARVLKAGALAPRFTLPNGEEWLVDSAPPLARGPLGGTVYPGRWWASCNA